jgi:hypothetical protein
VPQAFCLRAHEIAHAAGSLDLQVRRTRADSKSAIRQTRKSALPGVVAHATLHGAAERVINSFCKNV